MCLARGSAGSAPPGVRLVRADRTQPSAYDEVTGPWDEVIELSYAPELVTGALRALSHDAAHWTLVSSVSVYARNDEPDADESADLVDPRDLSQYANAKVAAERATVDAIGDRLFIARQGLIVGPGDPSDRFGYWLLGGPAGAATVVARRIRRLRQAARRRLRLHRRDNPSTRDDSDPDARRRAEAGYRSPPASGTDPGRRVRDPSDHHLYTERHRVDVSSWRSTPRSAGQDTESTVVGQSGLRRFEQERGRFSSWLAVSLRRTARKDQRPRRRFPGGCGFSRPSRSSSSPSSACW